MNFHGAIIEESLKDKEVLKKVKILKTEVEKVTESHKTPWLKQWTVHTVEVEESVAEDIANELSKCLETAHNWYADFKNKESHYIIFAYKVFMVNRKRPEEYESVKKYGVSVGIPEYQLDFSPDIE